MKILVLAPYIYVKEIPSATRNQSGLAYMIRDITDMLSCKNDVFVLTQSVFCSSCFVGNWQMVKKNIFSLICGFRWNYIVGAIKIIRNEKPNNQVALRTLLYFLTGAYCEKIIKRINPDVLHIHGIGLYTLPFLLAACRTTTQVKFTLHGLISFNEATRASSFDKKLEKKLLQLVVKKQYSISFISTGMKEKVQRWLNNPCGNIQIILNASIYINKKAVLGKKPTNTIVCIGSLSERKNQMQLVKNFNKIKEQLNRKLNLIIIGDGPDKAIIQTYIIENKLENIELLGLLPRDQVIEILSYCDLLVMPSLDEGFGLPVIEAYACGVPAVTFSDLDAIPDIYSPDCMILSKDREDISLQKSIIEALNKKWDRTKIIDFAQKFSISKITQEYENYISRSSDNIYHEEDIKKFLE